MNSSETQKQDSKGRLIIISSPSGGGKGTLIRELLKRMPSVKYSVSHTTRAPREGETNGVEYFFVSEAEFEKRIEEGSFIEHARVHGNYYGTSSEFIESSIETGTDVILEIDVQGARQIDASRFDSLSIFILPPSFDVLRERLTERGTESDEDVAVRLKNSFDEIAAFEDFDYAVVNDELEKAVDDLVSIVSASRLATGRQKDIVRDILSTFENQSEDKK